MPLDVAVDPSQVAETLPPAVAPETTQEPAGPFASQPETETTPKPETPARPPESKTAEPPAKFTDEERTQAVETLRQREQEVLQLRQQQQRSALDAQIAQMQAAEERAVAADNKEVGEGAITQGEADQRAQTRQTQRQLEWQTNLARQQLAQVNSQAEQMAYLQVAHVMAGEIGKEEGFTPQEITDLAKDLLKHERFSNPQAMEAYALRAIVKRHREALRKATVKPESFDRGPGATGGTLSDKEFLRAFNEGELNSPDAFKRAAQLINAMD